MKNIKELDLIQIGIAILFSVWGIFANNANRKIDIRTFVSSLFLSILAIIGVISYTENYLLGIIIGGIVGYLGYKVVYLLELAIAEKLHLTNLLQILIEEKEAQQKEKKEQQELEKEDK